ncbi:hypothetical protein D3C72_1571610 [compost metagenome]
MHDHHGREVVDPEVIALVVTQAANCRQRLFLCSLFAQGAGGFEVVVIGQQAAGGLHDVLGFLGFGMVEIVVDLLEHQHAQGQQHDHRHNQDEPQASADRHTAQAVHNAVTPDSFSCNKRPPASNHDFVSGHTRPKSYNAAALIRLVC